MSDIADGSAKVQVEATRFRSSVSEALLQLMGAAINYCLDYVVSNNAALATSNGRITAIEGTAAKLAVATYSTNAGTIVAGAPQLIIQNLTNGTVVLGTMHIGANTSGQSMVVSGVSFDRVVTVTAPIILLPGESLYGSVAISGYWDFVFTYNVIRGL